MKLRTRVFLNFVLLVAMFGLLAGVVGAVVINRTVVNEAQRRVSLDLRSAWSVLNGELQKMQLLLRALGRGERVARLYAGTEELTEVRAELESIRRLAGLDFLAFTDRRGRVVLRTCDPYETGDMLAGDALVEAALKGESATGFSLLSPNRLRAEGLGLPEQAYIVFEPTPKAKPRARDSEASGMALMAAVPALDEFGDRMGVAYAGVLLNRNHKLVDHIRSIVFEDQRYEGRHLGTVTIFQWDVRIATNVVKANGNRALGTRVSQEVYDRVLENDQSWYDRAFVVNDWYISAYDPIHDPEGKTIGILYVGVLAEKYDDARRELWAVFGGLSLLVALVVVGVGMLFAARLTGSLHRLAEAATKVAGGDLEHSVQEPASRDEIRDLTNAFNTMTVSLYDREQRLKRANRELQQLNADYLDLLGFVSHELKNTLGIIFTAARSLDSGLIGQMSEPQARLVRSIRRSIETAVTMTRQYLDLAHIEQGELQVNKRPIDLVEDVVTPVVEELAPAAEEHDVAIQNELPERAPLWGDMSLLRVVYKNLLDNALKYGREGGTIRLLCEQQSESAYRLEVWNEGAALPSGKVDALFKKFARFDDTDRAGRRGTGLGLFITREIIRKHGGDIRAESRPGGWISFIFTLPVLPPEQEADGDGAAQTTEDSEQR